MVSVGWRSEGVLRVRPSVYLAGPISGLTYASASDWRKYAVNSLGMWGIEAYSPLRVKDYLHDQGILEKQYQGLHPLSDDKGIITRDRHDVLSRDMMLINFLGCKDRISIGTCIEIGWADSARKPIVAVMEEHNVHRHAMVVEACGFIVSSFYEGLEIVKAVLLP